MTRNIRHIRKQLVRLGAAAAFVSLGSCVADDFGSQIKQPSSADAFTLTMQSNKMLPTQVAATRASDPKDEAEKEINQLYLFFFDAQGQYLETYQNRFIGFQQLVEGQSTVKVDRSAINELLSGATDKTVTVYAVANVEPEIFVDNDNDGKPDDFEGTDDKTPRKQLEEYVYRPQNLNLGLPRNGMPMIGYKDIDFSNQQTNNAIIEMKALMARIDVSIKLASDVSDGNLPALNLMEWKVIKAPRQVAFTAPVNGLTGALTDSIPSEDTATPYTGGTIYNGNGVVNFSFYMFENMQNKNTAWNNYPAGVDATSPEAQRYKPYLATEDATALQLHAFYSTYNDDGQGSATYDVTYTLYLGANHTDDFKVKRNHQYKNDITIKGLTQVGNNPDHITFDARVNVVEDNPFYIAILRERNHDAHFCVTPMDVYLFDGGTMTVTLGADADEDGKPWIRVEKVSSSVMSSGNAQDDNHLGYPGEAYHAGTGKRKYFTKSLLEDLSEQVTLNHRDRVYFYLDENLKLEDREAVVTLTYTPDGEGESKTRTLVLAQTHLLPVSLRDGGTIYMEAYEEYLNHYDPLNEFITEDMYTGLPWAVSGTNLANTNIPQLYRNRISRYEDPFDVYNDGLPYTSFLMQEADQGNKTLNEVPESAAEYCFQKNIRQDDNTVPIDYETYLFVAKREIKNQSKWFLPGIRQMEDALTQYRQSYEEFRENFYWSVSAGKAGTGNSQNPQKARATKAFSDGSYAGSSERNEDQYTNEEGRGGSAYRTQSLRIRAFRIDLNPVE